VRKAKARAEQATVADTNRARHGRTLAERERDRLGAEQAANRLDGARLSEDDPSASP
jgi:hypothetical protein